MQLFCDVAQHRSISKGAAMHGVTQSAASQRIRELERQLGVTLIDRSVRPLGLTPGGEIFYEGCCDLLRRYDKLTSRVQQLRDPVEGQVRVDAIYSAGIGWLNQLREAFEAEHPKVQVHVEYKHPDVVHDAVRHQYCDLGIVSFPSRWQGVGTVPLREEPMAVVCAPTHPLAERRQVHARDLTDQPMVAFEPELPVGRRIRRYLKENDATPRITAVFDNIDTIKGAVAVTDQVAILPERTVRREVESGQLAAISLEPQLVRPLGIIYRRGRGNRHLSPAAQSLVDYLVEHAGPPGELSTSGSSNHKQPHLVGGEA